MREEDEVVEVDKVAAAQSRLVCLEDFQQAVIDATTSFFGEGVVPFPGRKLTFWLNLGDLPGCLADYNSSGEMPARQKGR